MHHPPINGSERVRRQLRDGKGFRKVMADAGAELVLHGHNHRLDQGTVRTPLGEAPVIGVPSASAWPRHGMTPAAYHIYRIGSTPDGWSLRMDSRTFDCQTKTFIPAGHKTFELQAALTAASAA